VRRSLWLSVLVCRETFLVNSQEEGHVFGWLALVGQICFALECFLDSSLTPHLGRRGSLLRRGWPESPTRIVMLVKGVRSFRSFVQRRRGSGDRQNFVILRMF